MEQGCHLALTHMLAGIATMAPCICSPGPQRNWLHGTEEQRDRGTEGLRELIMMLKEDCPGGITSQRAFSLQCVFEPRASSMCSS